MTSSFPGKNHALVRLRFVSRLLSIFSALVGLLILIDLCLPANIEKLILSDKDKYFPTRGGTRYEFYLDGSDSINTVSVSKKMFRRAKVGDYVSVKSTPMFGLDRRIELFKFNSPVEVSTFHSWLTILAFLFFSFVPLISFSNAKRQLEWKLQLALIGWSIVFIIYGANCLSQYFGLYH